MKYGNRLLTGIIFILSVSGVIAQDGGLSVLPDPGTYTWNQVVSISCEEGYKILYSFRNNSTDPDIPYSEPFLLSALPSEERSYNLIVALLKDDIVVERRDFEYTIDKQSPRAPFINIPQGVYNHPVTVSLESQSEAQIVYSLGGSETSPLRVWRGEPVVLSGNEGGDSIYKISAYAVDNAGNKSRVENWAFRITTPGVQESELDILSPVPGNFRNQQLLYLKEKGYSWIRFTTNGADPELSGSTYTGPVLLRKSGDVTLKIAAMPVGNSDGPDNFTVEFTAGDEFLENIPSSGSYSTTLNFSAGSHRGFYCMDERSPEFPDPEFYGEIRLHSIPQGYRTLPLRVKTDDEKNAEFRYFYILDNRYPSDPVILSREDSPLTSRTQITLEGSDFSSIYYTLDGSSPDMNSNAYTGPFMLNIPDESNSGSLIVKARAFSKNGNVSTETSRLFTYNRAVPDTPTVEVIQEDSNSEALINVKAQSSGNQILYEISSDPEKIKTINRNSPVFHSNAVLDVPKGQKNTFYLVFSARDGAGNLSEPSSVTEITVDRRTDTVPLIEHRDGFVYIYGPENLYYSIENENMIIPEEETDAEDTVIPGIKYLNPFQLQGRDDDKTVINVTAWVENEDGRKGESSGKRIVIPGTVPAPPVYYGVDMGGIYNNKTVIVYISAPGENESVHYNYAMGDIPVPEINSDSPVASDNLFFTGMPGEISSYHLVMKTRNMVTGQFSDPVEVEFTLDLEPPVIPEIHGAVDESIYSGEVSVKVPEGTENSVFISFSYNDDPPGDPFGENGGRLFNEKRFSIPDGVSRKVNYRIGAEDIAGNRSSGKEVHWFIIDNTKPQLPEISGLPEKGLSSAPVTLNFDQNDKETVVHYQVTYDGTIPEKIDSESPVFGTSGLYFKGTDGLKIPVILRYKSKNLAGTWSDDENLVYFVIDRMAPSERGELQFQVLENQKKFILSWDVEANQELFFRIPELGDDFLLFNEPVTLPFPDGKDSLTVESYVSDRAGNSSGMQIKSIRFPNIREGELIGGYPDSGLTNSLVRLFRIESSGLMRYEIGTGGEEPGSVSRFSPVFPKSMDLDSANGEKIDYVLKVRSFSGIGAGGAGTEQIIRFTIDKTKPVAPVLVGAEDGEHYQEDLVLTFPKEDSDIYFAVQKGIREDNPGFPDFNLYRNPVIIESREGTFDTYRVYAYRKDRAGNQSSINEWEFYIDREIIYVSNDGNDLNAGTRSRPFKTIEKAVDYSDLTGRNTVFLAGGEYEVNESIVVPEELNIIGGFDSLSWENGGNGESVIMPGEFFPEDRPFFLIAGKCIFKNILFETEGNPASALLHQEGGELVIEDSKINLRSSSLENPVVIYDGTLKLKNTVVTGTGFSGKSLINAAGGDVIVNQSRLYRKESGSESLLIDSNSGSSVKILGTLLSPGDARSTMSVSIDDGTLWIDEQSELMTGKGSIDAIAVHGKDAEITILNSTIGSDEGARVVQGIFCEKSTIILQDSFINLEASVGVVGIQSNDSRFLIMGNTITAEADDFIFAFRSTRSNGRGINNYINTEETSDLNGIVIERGTVSWFHNTMIFRGGNDSASGILCRRGEELNIINNIIISDNPGESGTGLKVDADNLRIQGNNLHGWETLFASDKETITEADEFNLSDNSHSGGVYHMNIDEGPEKSFTDKYDLNPHLRRNSACINGGVDTSLHKDMLLDWDRERRPNPDDGIKPVADIGADEYYP